MRLSMRIYIAVSVLVRWIEASQRRFGSARVYVSCQTCSHATADCEGSVTPQPVVPLLQLD